MSRQRMGEKVETDRIIGYTIHLESIYKLQEPGKVHTCLLIVQAMELDGRCNQLNPAWLDLEVVWWNGRIEDDGADVGDPWSVVILHCRTRRRWLMLNPTCLGNWVVPQDLIHWGNLERHPLGRVFRIVHLVLLKIAAQVAIDAHFLRSQSRPLLSP
ncbi:unnamed protein product [Linum trigynum]|uniref:Uncharacterized protein n=1 Tax=Linum trigynum TaxID=586398 RepID=A0AAV2DCF6_9ROSI